MQLSRLCQRFATYSFFANPLRPDYVQWGVAEYGELARCRASAIPVDSKFEHRTEQQRNLNVKRIIMKKYAKFLVAVTVLLGLGVGANAESSPMIYVNLPFAFVVSGKTLPAGTYTATRLSYARYDGLILTNRANGSSVFLLPNEVEDASSDKPHVTFKQNGGQRFLSAIQSADEVYNIPVPRLVSLEAAAESRQTVSVSGTVAGN